MKKIKRLLVVLSLFVLFGAVSVSAATIKKGSTSVQSITPDVVKTGDEKISDFAQYTVSYSKTASDYRSVQGSNYYAVVVPITVPSKGDLYIEPVGTAQITNTTTARVFTDQACTSKADYHSLFMLDVADFKLLQTSCAGKGTYYLAFYTSDSSKFTKNTFSFRTYFYNAADRTLSDKKWSASAENDGTERNYKVVLKKAGHIIVQANQNMSITIRNKNKAVIYDSTYLSKDNSRKASYFLSKGTYYISTKGAFDVYKLRYTYYKLGASGFKAQKGKTFTIYPGTSKAYQYVQYKASVTGYVTLTQPGTDSGYITLCNSKRKALSSEDWIYGNSSSSNRLVYGVKKGTTYYLKIKSGYAPFKIKVTETKVKESSGASKKKAVSIKAKKTVKGTIQAGSKAADWYKFTVSKAKKVTITVKGNTNDRLKVEVFQSNDKSVGSTTLSGYNASRSLESWGKFKKGTYYIKVSRYNDKSSGNYSISWK